jgi:glycosyltransferase involved in cell wall biosynthesis
VVAQLEALQRAGHDARLFAARTDEREAALTHRPRAVMRVATGFGHSPIEGIRSFAPDVVHLHNLFPNFGNRWVSDLAFPVVMTLHNFRVVCAKATLFRDGGICTLCPDGARFAGVRHACYRGSRLATIPIAWSNRQGPRSDPAVQRADRIVVLSERSRDLFVRFGLDPSKLVVSSNFLTDGLVPPAPGSDASRESWLFVGRLSPEKGIVRLLSAWPDAERLRVIGTGPSEAEARHAARGKSVEFLGSRTRGEVLAEMGRSVGLVFCSQAVEGFPLVYAEALAADLPVLAFPPSVVSDFVEQDATGSAVTWEDPLEHVLPRTARHFGELRGRCRSKFIERYSESAYVERTEALYRELVT